MAEDNEELETIPVVPEPTPEPTPIPEPEPEPDKKRIINYHNGEKLYNKEYIDSLLAKKQDVYIPPEPSDPDDPDNPGDSGTGSNGLDTEINGESENAVQNKAIAAALEELDTKSAAADKLLEEKIDEEKQRAEEAEASLARDSVKIGETMFWPQSETTTRIVGSDAAVVFSYDDKLYSVEPEQNVEVKMCVARNVPEGWAPCDGTARYKCEDYPELAKFFRGTRNEDGTWNCDGNNVADKWLDGKSADARIWIPYCAQRIIKISY